MCKNKTLAGLMALVMAVFLLAGCTQQAATTLPLTGPYPDYPDYTGPTSTNPESEVYTLIVERKGADNTYYDETILLSYDQEGNLLEYRTEYRSMTFTYDDRGNVTSKTISNLKGEVQSKTDYFYDQAGRLVEISSFGYSEVYTTYKTLYFYDSDGNLSREEEYTNDELHFAMTYDAKGNILEGFSYIGGEGHSVYTYNEDGNLLKVSTTQDGELVSGSKWYYNDQGDPIREERFLYSKGERKELVNTYTYDDLGRCIRLDLGGYQGEQSSEEYTYDELGRMLSVVYTHYTGEVNAGYWTYDDAGNIIAFTSQGKNATNYAYTWNYDADGYVTDYTYDGNTYHLHYTWPDAEPTEKMWENILVMLYNFLSITPNTPEAQARLYQ